MRRRVKVAFASGPDELNRALIDRMTAFYPELDLYVVSEFPPEEGRWIPYHITRSLRENLARCRAELKGAGVRLAGVLLVPQMPYRRMRMMALLLSPVAFLAFNENLDSFMLRPRCLIAICRHLFWRCRNFVRWYLRPQKWRFQGLYWGASAAGWLARWAKMVLPARRNEEAHTYSTDEGISVVIPSRNGRDLLSNLLPGLLEDVKGIPSEVIVVDNGSDDDTAEFLRAHYPGVLLEGSPAPLSFARAVNRGIRRARYSHVCLLNNDMVVEPGFLAALLQAFSRVPELFCATAQIVFPSGMRREETGKAVMAQEGPKDFPVRCDVPVPGEDMSYVLYGSGGCSLYSKRKLAELGGLDEAYSPAYVEDLDLGYRAWLRGWPTVFAAGAKVEHRHRATTSRYFTAAELETMLETNYLRFLARAVTGPVVFGRLWGQAVRRLQLLAEEGRTSARQSLRQGLRAAAMVKRPPAGAQDEELFLALGSGRVAVFPGNAPAGSRRILIAAPYLPFPLSHGGAVRMYNLIRRASRDWGHILVCFADRIETPSQELLDVAAEIVVVQRVGSHSRPSTPRPDMVEEFDSLAFRAALRQTIRKWEPEAVQLEFTQMAQYAEECRPRPTILVEHDVTFDLYQQLAHLDDNWETQRQLVRWRSFETEAWRRVSCVVTMSEKDRRMVAGTRAVVLPNGVDLEKFQPGSEAPEPGRLLFIGSFAHLPNLLAIEFFLSRVWPLLDDLAPTLHVIGGARHEYFLKHYLDRVRVNLSHPRIEMEGFVADPRPAYRRATLVLAPLVASAGTNIKILEAMAMGKAIVSTPPGINGLDLRSGEEVVVAETPESMAQAICHLLSNPGSRLKLETQARAAAVRDYSWDVIARKQAAMYQSLRATTA